MNSPSHPDDPDGAPWCPGAARALAVALLATSLSLLLVLGLGSPAGWLVIPILSLTPRNRLAAEYGLDLRLTPPSLVTQAAVVLALLFLYAAAHALAASLVLGLAFRPHWPGGNPALDFGREFLLVGLPEEIFFRGYLQSELDRALPPRRYILGAPVGGGLVLQAIVFGLCHLVAGDWTRLQTIVFGLLAGWLRARSGSVVMPAFHHATANLWYRAVSASFS